MWVDVKVRSQAFRLSPNPDLLLPTIFLFFIISLINVDEELIRKLAQLLEIPLLETRLCMHNKRLLRFSFLKMSTSFELLMTHLGRRLNWS